MIGSVEESLEVYRESLRDYLVWAKDQKEKSRSWVVGSGEAILYKKENTRRLSALETMAKVLKLSEEEEAQIENEIRKEIETS